MKNEKMILQEIPINFAPGFGDVPQKFDGVEIIVK